MNERIENLKQPLLEASFRRLELDDTPVALATVVQAISPTSGKPGDKALVNADTIVEGWIGGGCAQSAVIEAAGASLQSGESALIRVGPKGEWEPMQGVVDFASGCLSGGTLLIFVEPMIRQPALSILGHSPVARKLAGLAGQVGFSVTLEDDFTGIDADYLVIATQGQGDRDAIKAALASRARHIAMIASHRKITELKASFARGGTDTAQLDRIHSPAGIDIGAVPPAEIALSVLAELVCTRRGTGGARSHAAQVAEALSDESVTEAENTGGCCGG